MKIINLATDSPLSVEQALTRAEAIDKGLLKDTVSKIISNVRTNGDKALFAYAKEFDSVDLDSLLVSPEEYAAADTLDAKYKDAILKAIENISYYHWQMRPKAIEYQREGITLGKFYRPINTVGLYIPGGTAPLVSTLMMLALPAKIAGCKTQIVTSPPNKEGKIPPAILFAARECGIKQLYKVGGAQAISAMAFGTESIPKVQKIFGPGNKFVTEAKVQVAMSGIQVALDMPAGPSEVLVIGDDGSRADFIASDLLAQAEHDKDAQVILVTTSENLAKNVLQELTKQTAFLSRKDIITASLAKSSIILCRTLDECFDISNRYAPEHLILHIKDPIKHLDKVMSAGSVFVGEYSPEALGDYASGSNHVLPTYGYAAMYSGLDTMAFMKGISFQSVSADGLTLLGDTVESLATLEGLDAHKNAVTIRLNQLKTLGK